MNIFIAMADNFSSIYRINSGIGHLTDAVRTQAVKNIVLTDVFSFSIISLREVMGYFIAISTAVGKEFIFLLKSGSRIYR
jgi:hypothetical protein